MTVLCLWFKSWFSCLGSSLKYHTPRGLGDDPVSLKGGRKLFFLNTHDPLKAMGLVANVDDQVVLTVQAAVNYLTKYLGKEGGGHSAQSRITDRWHCVSHDRAGIFDGCPWKHGISWWIFKACLVVRACDIFERKRWWQDRGKGCATPKRWGKLLGWIMMHRFRRWSNWYIRPLTLVK